MEVVPIQAVTVRRIREVISDAIDGKLKAAMLADFLALVDWSHFETADATVRDLLGTLEHWDTEFAERDLTEAEYTERLRSVLAAKVPV